MNKKQGFSIHCHHDTLIEFCYDYDKRAEYIKKEKPQNEQKTRLRLFKLLSQKAIKELPKNLEKAYAEREKADAKWKKAYAEAIRAAAKWDKAYTHTEKTKTNNGDSQPSLTP